MKMKVDIEKAMARLETLAPEFAGDPRQCEEFDPRDADMYREAEDGRFVLDTEKQADLLRAGRALQLQAENDRLREQAERRTVVEDLRRALAGCGVNRGLVDAAAALFMTTHQFAIGPDGKVSVVGRDGSTGDCLQAAVRFVEREENKAMKSRDTGPADDGEFTRMVRQLQH